MSPTPTGDPDPELTDEERAWWDSLTETERDTLDEMIRSALWEDAVVEGLYDNPTDTDPLEEP